MTADLPAYYDDIDKILEEIWNLFYRGVDSTKNPLHEPTLITVDSLGSPRARTMILRGFDRETRTVLFHTDRRSPKMDELNFDPRAVVHIWDGERSVQIRARVEMKIHVDDELADSEWEKTSEESLKIFTLKPRPGTAIEEPPSLDENLDEEDWKRARENFAVLRGQMCEVEWLYLHPAGPRRALFDWTNHKLEQTWLVP